MRNKLLIDATLGAAFAGAIAFAAPAMAQGWGMMNSGGPGYGMMDGYGPGYGMMRGDGYGCGGPGYGMMNGYGMPGYGPGMMGGGYGPGWRGRGYQRSWMMNGQGPGYSGQSRNLDLSVDDVKKYVEQMIDNPRLKVGDIKEKDTDTITAEVVTKDKDALVQTFAFDRHTGGYQPEQ